MKKTAPWAGFLCLFLLGPAVAGPFPGAKARLADYDWLTGQIATRYAYLPERGLDLGKLRGLYRQEAEKAATRAAFIHVLEEVVGELYDHHATLGTKTPASPQMIPSGTDLWAEVRKGRALISEVRPDSPAEAAGVKAGDKVIRIAGHPAAGAIASALPKSLKKPDPEAASFALRTLLAGNHQDRRRSRPSWWCCAIIGPAAWAKA